MQEWGPWSSEERISTMEVDSRGHGHGSGNISEDRVRELIRELTPPRAAAPAAPQHPHGATHLDAEHTRRITVRGWNHAARRDDIVAALSAILLEARIPYEEVLVR
eukprot:6275933-Amphidinium_carterae.1